MVMVTTTRTQNRYDHRPREVVLTTQDVRYAVQCGVPRSTARGWLNVPSVEVVTLDSLDVDTTQLHRELLRLQTRIRKLIGAVCHNILHFFARVLVILLGSTRESRHHQVMATTTRFQRKYDHRLRELV